MLITNKNAVLTELLYILKRMNFYQFLSAIHCATATSLSKSVEDFGKAQYNSVMRYSQIRV